jgi:hypothetical protein
LIKIINENEINSGRRNSGLQYKLSELNDKLEPFIKLAVNKYPNLKIDDALLKLEYDLKEQKDKLSIIFEYSDVALLNYFGLPDKVGDFLIESSEISEILKGSYDRIDSMVFFKHDDISISKFKKVISEFPRFPFSYCAMAMALKDKGDPKWKEYVYKAVEILKKTTQISGHHRNHDEALKTLQQILKISK